MPALCLMLLVTYYAFNYAGIIGLGLQLVEKREQWEVVLVNVKHVLRSVLKALDYMHSQGLVHTDIKASNILIKMSCQCTEVFYYNYHQYDAGGDVVTKIRGNAVLQWSSGGE